MAERVFAGDDEQYFPDFGAWLKPGDPVPDGAPDDPRFIPAPARRTHHPRTSPKPPRAPVHTSNSSSESESEEQTS